LDHANGSIKLLARHDFVVYGGGFPKASQRLKTEGDDMTPAVNCFWPRREFRLNLGVWSRVFLFSRGAA